MSEEQSYCSAGGGAMGWREGLMAANDGASDDRSSTAPAAASCARRPIDRFRPAWSESL